MVLDFQYALGVPATYDILICETWFSDCLYQIHFTSFLYRVSVFTYKMKSESTSMEHFLEPTWIKPTGQFCLPLHYSLQPSQDMLFHAIPAHLHIFRQSGPCKREKQHMMCSPRPYTCPTLSAWAEATLCCWPISQLPGGRCLFENMLLFPQYELKGKFIFPYWLRQKNATVLWNSLQIVSFY